MFTDLSKINRDQFFLRPCQIGGVDCVLVEPVGVGVPKWDKSNLIYRSSIWTIKGELVSAGFQKFFNYDEDLDKDGNYVPGKIPFQKPKDLKGGKILEKMDGSLLIVSKYNGQLIIRTRGTIDAAATLSNGDEIAFLKQKYSLCFELLEGLQEGYSYLFEWFSPRNKIVINYGDEPQLWLIGRINHGDYSLANQEELDAVADIFAVPRPAYYTFDSLEEMRKAVKALEGKEGFVFYVQDAQGNWIPWKDKSLRYLSLHYYKADVSTPEKILDMWLAEGKPSYQDFYNYLSTKYDWEIADYARPDISRICDAYVNAQRIIAGFNNFILHNAGGVERKEFYRRAGASYGGEKNSRVGMIMSLYSGKELSEDMMKKLILQCVYK